MSFDREALIEATKRHGMVARVVVASVRGSAPREVGAAMLVWVNGQIGTIGGGALEFELAEAARSNLVKGRYLLSRHALGPDMGQCCGGAVEIVTEVFDHPTAQGLPDQVIARGKPPMPLAVRRLCGHVRREGVVVRPKLIDGWMVEPVCKPTRHLWVWGAGHVGRALVSVLSPFPDMAITWVDTARDRFPEIIPDGVNMLVASDPGTVVPYAPAEAEHLILTYSHAIDLDLCHRLLRHDFRSAGLIGSATKWARFRNRLAALGHAPRDIARLQCPIGDPHLGKHPQAIAVGVAAGMLSAPTTLQIEEKRA